MEARGARRVGRDFASSWADTDTNFGLAQGSFIYRVVRDQRGQGISGSVSGRPFEALTSLTVAI